MLPLAALDARSRQGIWPASRVELTLFSVKIQACIVLCEERERLTQAYVDAAEANRKASESVEDIKSYQWSKATKQTRLACDSALVALKLHISEHKC